MPKEHEHDEGAAKRANVSGIPDDTARTPKAKVVVIHDYCIRSKGAECDRCERACPHGSISFSANNRPVVDSALCTACGICYGICDAFSSTHLTMVDLHARIRRIAASGQRAYLTCRENIFPDFIPDTNVIVLPCLSMVPPELWTLLLTEKIRVSIACDLTYCEDCERAGAVGGELFPRAIELAELRTGDKIRFSYRIPEKQKLLEKYAENDTLGRRQAFTGLAADVGEIATGKRRLRNSEVLQDYYEKKERQRAVARLNLVEDSAFNKLIPEGRIKHTMFPRRKMLIEAVQRQPDIARRIPLAISATEAQLCAQTYDCVNVCPTGAREPDISTGEVKVDAALCVGCGICVDTCQQGACELQETTAAIFASDRTDDEAEGGADA